jgi:hypothetical protein
VGVLNNIILYDYIKYNINLIFWIGWIILSPGGRTGKRNPIKK